MDRAGNGSATPGAGDGGATDAAFTALLEDSAEELYESAPCGYLSTLMDGTIAKINATLLGWLGLRREAVVGRLRFADLLTVGGKLYHETHFAPLLRMQGEINGIALEIKTHDGGRLPVLVSSVVKHGSRGDPLLIRTTVFDASARRAYEEELLHRRKEAERTRAEADELRRRAEEDRARLAEALAALQQTLLPETFPDVPGVETAFSYHIASALQLGGDFYDLFPVGEGRWAFFIGDVCGKGPQAAAVTSLIRYTLRTAVLHTSEPATALATLNIALHERYTASDDPRYCTAVLGVLEPDATTGHTAVRLASGGHPPALVLRASGEADFLATPGGMLIGVLTDAHFATRTTTLGPGDTLLLYTDGLTEARTGADRGSLYGAEALHAFAEEQAPTGARKLVDALNGLLEGFGDGLDDDTALVALGVPDDRPTPVHGNGLAR
ncbi:PP2C family protein-serine/threonine phosphatase [Streptomyces sp. NPDC020731]|uniref:PP2C family protein-serine/threonine phosphatase n=1 Tax=Streptomyces sp. NPDC020731 TaxID=3365085 RepID=UPI0037B26256